MPLFLALFDEGPHIVLAHFVALVDGVETEAADDEEITGNAEQAV